MELAEFLKTVITTPKGYFCLANATTKNTEEETFKTWNEEFFSWPDDLPIIIDRIVGLGRDRNIYFSPYLFSEKNSLKNSVLPSRTIVADLDEANVLTLELKPNVLVETSPDRHQGYWILKEGLSIEDHEALSKRLTYSIPRCDKTGWFAGKKVRVPGTMNLKYTTGVHQVRVVDIRESEYRASNIEALPSVQELFGEDSDKALADEDLSWIKEAQEIDIGPQELLNSVRHVLGSRVVAQYNKVSYDRSAALWGLMIAAFKAGLTKEKVFHLAYHSVNNKFNDLRYGAVSALGKDVLRAELSTKVKSLSIRSTIAEARRLGAMEQDKNNHVANMVLEHLLKIGSFYHTYDEMLWYIRHDNGRPISLSGRSESLFNMIDNIFGINASEKITNYTINRLISYASELPANSQSAAMSYYDVDTGTFMLSTGRRETIMVTQDNISKVYNGHDGIIFPWVAGNNVISPIYKSLDRSWDTELFDGCLNNIVGMEPKHAQAILKAWLITVLMRDGLSARPILALFGMPGSGKSTLCRRVYTLLYGKGKSVNGVTKEDDFDYAVATDPLVVLDNVDSAVRWLPDRIALSASSSEITKRKLFTDMDTIRLKRQAMLVLNAHNPHFVREDVMDRLLLFNFERLQHFVPETQILDRIHKLRSALWGAILADIQKILAHPVPSSGWPQFRIEDFSRFGYQISQALGTEEDFYNGIETITKEQKLFIISEEDLLVEALRRYVEKQPEKAAQERTAGQLWTILELLSSDPDSFKKRYRNAVSLGKKLWIFQTSLKQLMKVKWRMDSSRGARVWSFEPLAGSKVNGKSG